MKIRVLTPKRNLLGYQLLVKTLNDGECNWYLTEDFQGYYVFIIDTDSVFIRKYIYTNYYYERLGEDNEEKEE